MEKLIDRLSAVVAEAFSAAGYDPACGRVTVSNRPDLCEFQCNGAMPAAKPHHKAPARRSRRTVVRHAWRTASVFDSVEAVKPGFINLQRLRPAVSGRRILRADAARAAASAWSRERKRRAPSCSTTAARTWPSRCTSATCAPPSSARASSASTATSATTSSATSTWATGACRWASSSPSCSDRMPDLPYFDPRASPATYPEGSAVHDLRAGGDLPRGQRPARRRTRPSPPARTTPPMPLQPRRPRLPRPVASTSCSVSVADLQAQL